MTPAAFEYHESPPPSAVDLVVHSLWGFWTTRDAPERSEHTIWPDGCVSFGVAIAPKLPALFIRVPASVTATTRIVVRGSRFLGFRLWPDCAGIDVGTSARDALVKSVAPLTRPEDVWEALATWCIGHLADREPPDPIVRTTIDIIINRNGDVATTELSHRVDLGARQLQRRFRAATGLTIKSYARVRRMRAALGYRLQQAAEPWSSTAAATGFADQAHLTREFTSMTGLAPRQAERHLARIEHRNVTP